MVLWQVWVDSAVWRDSGVMEGGRIISVSVSVWRLAKTFVSNDYFGNRLAGYAGITSHTVAGGG